MTSSHCAGVHVGAIMIFIDSKHQPDPPKPGDHDWHPESWKAYPARQQPQWADQEEYERVLCEISEQPPLVFAGEVRDLKAQFAQAVRGDAFVLQAGDCAEEFDQSQGKIIREKLKVILQMAVVLTFGNLKPVVKVGRIAGQYAKPRSNPTEWVAGCEIPCFRGDSVNSFEATLTARAADPTRLLRAYHQSACTLNLLRAFTHGGFADLSRVHAWNLDCVKNKPMGSKYESMAHQITQSLQFMRACGLDSEKFPQLNQADLFTSHEGLLLGYESALTRIDSLTGEPYNCSAHMLWIGNRTRQVDGAHVEYFRGVRNPLGVKIGPSCSPDELSRLLERLNPLGEAGRIVLITRFGADLIESHLPPLIRRVRRMGHPVVWSCDPMHGNTFVSSKGFKTRDFDQILKEIKNFFDIHQAEGTIPGGIHLEVTGDNVTECLGGAQHIKDEELEYRYSTRCDPRLNALQALEVAFFVSNLLTKRRETNSQSEATPPARV